MNITFNIYYKSKNGEEEVSNDIQYNKVIEIENKRVPNVGIVLGTGMINSGIVDEIKLKKGGSVINY